MVVDARGCRPLLAPLVDLSLSPAVVMSARDVSLLRWSGMT